VLAGWLIPARLHAWQHGMDGHEASGVLCCMGWRASRICMQGRAASLSRGVMVCPLAFPVLGCVQARHPYQPPRLPPLAWQVGVTIAQVDDCIARYLWTRQLTL